jgi:hypothetical protein
VSAREPTYDELRAQASAHWSRQQALAAKELAALHGQIQRMPDVLHAPAPGEPWGHPGIACACGSEGFTVPERGWVTVNGHRHRATLVCLGCKQVDTWDWATGAWLGMA